MKALDNTLAAIGGYTFLVYIILYFLVSWYDSFKLSSRLVKSLYQYQERPNSANGKPEEELMDDQFLAYNLKDRKPLKYNFCQYLGASILSIFGCCCKNVVCWRQSVGKLAAFKEASQRL